MAHADFIFNIGIFQNEFLYLVLLFEQTTKESHNANRYVLNIIPFVIIFFHHYILFLENDIFPSRYIRFLIIARTILRKLIRWSNIVYIWSMLVFGWKKVCKCIRYNVQSAEKILQRILYKVTYSLCYCKIAIKLT